MKFLKLLKEVSDSVGKQVNLTAIKDIEQQYDWLSEYQLMQVCKALKQENYNPNLYSFKKAVDGLGITNKLKIEEHCLKLFRCECGCEFFYRSFTGYFECPNTLYNKCHRKYTFEQLERM